jgi:hypothetical protein
MDEMFLTEADCAPNLNAATIAGKVITVEPLSGKTTGLAFTVGYLKHWPNGGSQEIPVRCYVTGERVEKLKSWMKAGEVVLVHGEITDKNAVYGHQVEQLSKPERHPGADDEYLAGMPRSRTRTK